MKQIITLMMLTVLSVCTSVAQDTWTVAGSSAFLGSFWDPTDTNNDMTTGDEVSYTLIKEGCILEAGVTYEYKVVKNHSWDVAYPSSNKTFTVPVTGKYTVIISFNVLYNDISEQTTKTGDAVVDDTTWTVAGGPEGASAGNDDALFVKTWDPTLTENDMTQQSDGTFVLEKNGVELGAITYNYKVLANHAWDESYGYNGGTDNDWFNISEAGIYDVVFAFNPNSTPKGLSVVYTNTATGIGEVITVDAQPVVYYNLAGQRVDAQAKGIVIANGKKFVRK